MWRKKPGKENNHQYMLCLSAKRFSFMKSKPRPLARREAGPKTPEQALSVRKGVARQIRAKFSFQVLLPMKLYWIWLKTRGVFLEVRSFGGFDRSRGGPAFRRLLNRTGGLHPLSKAVGDSDLNFFSVQTSLGKLKTKESAMGRNNERNKHRDTRNKRKRKASFCS